MWSDSVVTWSLVLILVLAGASGLLEYQSATERCNKREVAF